MADSPPMQCETVISLPGNLESIKLLGHRALPEIEQWPQVDEFALSEQDRLKFTVRKSAIEMYAAGAKISDILTTTRLVRSELFRYLNRALALHPHGRIWGMRALKDRKSTRLNSSH